MMTVVLVQCPAQCVCACMFVYVATVSLYTAALPQAQEGCEEPSPWLLVGRLSPVTTTAFVPLFEGTLMFEFTFQRQNRICQESHVITRNVSAWEAEAGGLP